MQANFTPPYLLRLFTEARRQHLRMTPGEVSRAAGCPLADVRAVLRGGPAAVPLASLEALAAFNEVPLARLCPAIPFPSTPAQEGDCHETA